MPLTSRIAGVAMAIAIGGSLFVSSALADTVSYTTTVGLMGNHHGQECAISLVVGSDVIFGRATWNAETRAYDLANAGVKNLALDVQNTKSSRPCRVDVRGKPLHSDEAIVPIHDLKLEEGAGSWVDVETVPQVPDQDEPEIPAWLIADDTNAGGTCAIVRATLSNTHLSNLPRGSSTGLVTLTASTNAP